MRRLFAIASTLSLVLCVGTALVWAFSYSGRGVWLRDPLGGLHINSPDGVWVVCFYDADLVVNHYLNDSTTRLSAADDGWHFGELVGYRYFAGRTQSWSTLIIALWVIVVVTAAMPLVWVANGIRRRIVSHVSGTRCLTCNYNLTGNTSGVCPECGTQVKLT